MKRHTERHTEADIKEVVAPSRSAAENSTERSGKLHKGLCGAPFVSFWSLFGYPPTPELAEGISACFVTKGFLRALAPWSPRVADARGVPEIV